MPGAIVLSVRVRRHARIPQLADGVLPINEESMSVSLGTTLGALPIFANATTPGVGAVATAATALSDYLIGVTNADLNTDRSLLVQYLCKSCSRQYKPAREIVAILLTGVSALLGVMCVGDQRAQLTAQLHDRALGRRVHRREPARRPQRLGLQPCPCQSGRRPSSDGRQDAHVRVVASAAP